MSEKNNLVKVSIFDREYSIKCPPEEANQLLEAAKILDTQMRNTSQNSNNANIERIAVVTALNMSYELARLKQQIGTLSAKVRKALVTEEEIAV